MKVWELTEPQKLELKESEPTVLKPNEIKVKIEEVLVSTSDLESYNGSSKHDYPFVLGRNAVGVVSEVYDREKSLYQKMDRVVIEPYIVCNTCKECAAEEYQKCSNLKYMGQNCNGFMQNFIDVPLDLVYHIPDNLSNEAALFVSYVAFCLNIVDSLNLEKGRHIAVFASTKTGVILAQLISYYQAVPILVSENEEILDVARDLGIFYCINNKSVDVEREVQTITGGRMCSALVLFCESNFSFREVYDAAAVNANICLAGVSNKDSRLSLAQISQKHLNIFGVYNGVKSFSSAINLLVTGTVKVTSFMGDTVSFEKLDEEFANLKAADLALKSKIIKVD